MDSIGQKRHFSTETFFSEVFFAWTSWVPVWKPETYWIWGRLNVPPECVLCYLCLADCLGWVCVHGCLPFCILLCVCVCVFGWKYYLCSIIPRPKRHRDLSGRHIKLLPSAVSIPSAWTQSITRALGDSRSPQCSISPPPITKPAHFVWLLVIISNNWNLIWRSLLPERYWSHPEWDAVWNLILFFICLYIICCPIRWHLHPVVWLIGWAPGGQLC